mmetsp:Transcript_87955/g.262287  ORF Transcript_87955/g.262287 Transcript_87955/m.262287 type:complete len:222 (+) Transcript_87955:73-738(+)
MGSICAGEGGPQSGSDAEVEALEYPTVFVNMFIEDCEEIVKDKAREKMEEKLWRPRFEIGKRLQEKMIAKVQEKAAGKMKKDMSPISSRMSAQMTQLLPAKLGEKGITTSAKVVFCQHSLFVIKLRVSNVSSELVLEAKKQEMANLGRVQSIIGKLPSSWRARLDSQLLPALVARKLTEVMGKTLEERMAEKGLCVHAQVCKAEEEAGLFFELYEQLKSQQ